MEWAALSLAGITAASKHRIGGIEIGIDRHIPRNIGLTDRQRDALQTLYNLIDLALAGSPSKQEEQRRGDGDGAQWTKGGRGLLLARTFPLADVLPRIRVALTDFLKEAGATPPDYRPPRPPSMIGHKKKDPSPDPLAWTCFDALHLLDVATKTSTADAAMRAGMAIATILLKLHVLNPLSALTSRRAGGQRFKDEADKLDADLQARARVILKRKPKISITDAANAIRNELPTPDSPARKPGIRRIEDAIRIGTDENGNLLFAHRRKTSRA